ncbi:MAG: tetratricopeptide repeat protein [Actinobacteria bacterium]|nr:tetratricopeptide repeat protein [Actinomycetota bacterium]
MTTQPGPGRPMSLRGAVDLSTLAKPQPAAGATSGAATGGGSAASGYVIDVTDDSFVADVVERSSTVLVIIDVWAEWCGPCKQLSPILEKIAADLDGRLLVAKVDVDANRQLAQAFQVQSIPTVFAVLKGQPVALFQGALPDAQVREVVAQLLQAAEANGVTGRIELAAGDAGDEAEDAEPVEEPLPPHHQAAYDAIDAGDYAAAITAYEAALNESPADEMARVGLAQVKLLARTADVDPQVARAAAAADPTDVQAQILVADLDLLGGHVDDAFSRLVDTVRVTAGSDRDTVRVHLVELFDVVGAEDPRVAQGRLALANALF